MSEQYSYDPSSIKVLKGLEAVRLRPGMYVGGTDHMGFIQYLLAPFKLLLEQELTYIEMEVNQYGIHIRSDAELSLSFVSGIEDHYDLDSMVLAGLSEKLSIHIIENTTVYTVVYEHREFQGVQKRVAITPYHETEITFNPDLTIFEETDMSFSFLSSFFSRQSHFYPNVQFCLIAGSTRKVFQAKGGISDLFDAFSKPFQLMHKPIHIKSSQEGITFELVFAYHSWLGNWIVPFVNHSRAVDGGTHESGLNAAFEEVSQLLKVDGISNGIIAAVSLWADNLQFEGCVRSKVSNPELHDQVKEMVVEGVKRWIVENPEEMVVFNQMRTAAWV